MKQILIVEDDSFLNKMVAYNLTADGSQLFPGILLRNLLAAFRENPKWIQCGL